jgi:hypothetical protein
MTLQNIKQWIEKYQDVTPADRVSLTDKTHSHEIHF